MTQSIVHARLSSINPAYLFADSALAIPDVYFRSDWYMPHYRLSQPHRDPNRRLLGLDPRQSGRPSDAAARARSILAQEARIPNRHHSERTFGKESDSAGEDLG
jgi:hypothetical protein